MINIRKNVFETNSSSMHSLVVSKKNRGFSYDLPVDINGKLVVEGGEYGWSPKILKTPIEKLSYWITDHMDDTNALNDAKEIILMNCPEVKDIEFVFGEYDDIDHQSRGTSDGVEFNDLIFNNNILILIDNDNSWYFDEYYSDLDNGKSEEDTEDLFDKEFNL